ncbi:alpha/beta hydrolase [Actinoplanes sp. NPDC024001]|uniref:alpha/beta hydrolase n=1 Tax=Actinoplanes sp. NPDC024001 TaxID=3154598 RepID=UPI003410A711
MTFVLVPGAWHLPSAFDLLRGELDRLGQPSLAVRLSTAGPEPRGGLREDAAAVRAAIEAVDGPVTVLAHSYGGIPVTEGAAGLANVERIIYLAAFVPDVGESMFTLLGLPDPAETDGLFPVNDDPRAQLYGDVPDEIAERAVRQLVVQRIQPWVDRVTQAAWHTVPTTYIVTDNDNSLSSELQERMAKHCDEVHHMPTSHSPFLSRPAELAALMTGKAGV